MDQNGRLTFSGTAGQRVSLQVTASTLADAAVTLIRPDQTSQYLGTFGTGSRFYDTVTLPSTGGYAIAIDPSATTTGCATFTLYDVPPDATASITPGGAAVGICNTVPGQNMRLTFTGTAGQQVSAWVTGSTLATTGVTLIWPDQSAHYLGSFGTGDHFYDAVTLPSTGDYVLRIDPTDAGTGCATFQLFTGADVYAAITPGGASVQTCNTVPS
ncbi:MAG TPA: hypothetical protein VFX49_00425, partial [Chloroflexota bacterium]|nr:hypothetical protein [Chloroflexota bacterium]